jgi:hypothetical protein
MENILNSILANIEIITTIILAISGLLATIIAEYNKIKKLLATEEFNKIAAPLISIAETNPVQILDKLANLPSPDIHSYVNTNEGKAMVVAQATIEKANPKILKKLGINNVTDAIPLVSALYQNIIKPIIKK